LQVEEDAYPVDKRRAYYDALLARLERIPGVEAATLANQLPTVSGGGPIDIFIEGQDTTAKDLSKANGFLVTPGYFKTLGIRLLDGRTFPSSVSADQPDQIVVNQSLARHFWPGGSPLGRRLGTRAADGKVTLREVIGVVADADAAIQFSEPSTRFQFYSNLTHTPWAYFQIAIRGDNPARLGQDLRRAVADVSPDLAARFVWTLDDMRDQFLHNLIVINGVLLAFASGRDVLRIVLQQSLVLTLVGLALGVAGSFALGLALRRGLGPMIAQNNLILAGTSVIIFLVALGATLIPAQRATKANPIDALRAE
jgi:hypothetical protein